MSVDQLNLIKYPENWNHKRVPARPKELQLNNFEKNFDWDNLWIDAIQINQQQIVLIGPPLYQTKDFMVSRNCRFVDSNNSELSYQFVERDRLCLTVVSTKEWKDQIWLVDDTNSIPISIRQPSTEFNGKKVIVTPSKNHPIVWLKQWIDYHVSVGIDAFLIYDNNTDTYTSEYMEEQLSRPDILIKVVKYNIPVGPMGGHVNGVGSLELPWDSDFSSYIMFEHAKWRYLHSAAIISGAHTDELLIFNGTTVDELVNKNDQDSAWIIHGKWIEPVNSFTGVPAKNINFALRSFDQYFHTNENEGTGGSGGVKWLIKPQNTLQYQWAIHTIYGPHVFTDSVKFGHFKAMNAGLERKRDDDISDPSRLVVWIDLKERLDKWIGRK